MNYLDDEPLEAGFCGFILGIILAIILGVLLTIIF
jgi:tetrahydromethanopterin S-methyltransferase subunit F